MFASDGRPAGSETGGEPLTEAGQGLAASAPVPAGRARPGLRRRPGRWAVLLLGAGLCLGAGRAPALSLEQLLQDPQLTPERLMRQVAGFEFRLGPVVQSPAEFLASRAGDCDDFARLAAEVLRRKGYTPRLVVVHMERAVHVVCYVNEIKGFLDYNRRQEPNPVVASGDRLEDVAEKVAASLRARWRTASEFVYEAGRPRCQRTAFR